MEYGPGRPELAAGKAGWVCASAVIAMFFIGLPAARSGRSFDSNCAPAEGYSAQWAEGKGGGLTGPPPRVGHPRWYKNKRPET
jgi:hypothetical protein